jgi:anti-anti-sigma factor
MAPKKRKKKAMEPSNDLSFSSETWNDWQILHLKGKFVVKSFHAVRTTIDKIESQDTPRLAIDLTDVSHIDSSALTIILNLQKRLNVKGGQSAIIGPNAEISETFSIVGFSLAVPIYSTRTVFEKSVLQK